MRKTLLLFTSLFLAACTVSAVMTIKPDQIYQGYPCGQDCAAFQQGFDTAAKEQFTNTLQCASLPMNQATGCQAYITEYLRTLPTFTDLKLK